MYIADCNWCTLLNPDTRGGSSMSCLTTGAAVGGAIATPLLFIILLLLVALVCVIRRSAREKKRTSTLSCKGMSSTWRVNFLCHNCNPQGLPLPTVTTLLTFLLYRLGTTACRNYYSNELSEHEVNVVAVTQ